ncbi:MAG: TrmB family transcriptional regulator [Candidatus Kerfeldbacteria bacterium]
MKQLLSLFNLRSVEASLYETLFYHGMMSASKLAKKVSVSRTSVYDLLERLVELGLVIETAKAGIKMFTVQPPKKLKLLLKEKQSAIENANTTLDHFQKLYTSQQQSIRPQLEIYEGKQALQQMMKDMLLYRDMTVYAFWPIAHIMKLLSPQFIKQFHQERINRNVQLKVIWPKSQMNIVKQNSFLTPNQTEKREARIAPETMDCSLGYSIYGNTVRYLSSSKENFGFLVQSQELVTMMKSQFNAIWSISKPYKPLRHTRHVKKAN